MVAKRPTTDRTIRARAADFRRLARLAVALKISQSEALHRLLNVGEQSLLVAEKLVSRPEMLVSVGFPESVDKSPKSPVVASTTFSKSALAKWAGI